MNDDEVIKQRISGRSARAIAKAQATTVAEVTLDRFTETTIDDKVRRHTLALELARLDELQETLLRPSPGRRRAVRCSNHENHRTPLHDALRPVLTELCDLPSRAIAAELAKRAIPTPRGGDWQSTTVMRLLRRLELR